MGVDYTLTTDTTNILIKIEFVFSVNSDGLYNIRCHSITGIRIKIVDYNDPAPNSNDSNDWPVLDDYQSTGFTNWSTKNQRYSHNLQISLQKNKIYKCYAENVRGESQISGMSNVFVGFAVNKNTTDTLGYPENKGIDYDIQESPDFTIYDTRATYDTTNNEWVDADSIYLDSTKYYEFLIELLTESSDPFFSIYSQKSDTNEFTSDLNDINTEFASLINLKSRFEVLKERQINVIRYDVYDGSELSDLTYVKTHFKKELLSWTGDGADTNDVTNLSLLTGDLGNERVTIIIGGYFTPVETNDYVFRFNDNDDAIAFRLIEYGNDINNGNIPLSANIRDYTSDTITLESTKTYEFWIRWRQATGSYNFELQVEVGNSGVFINLYDKNIFTFKSKYELLNERQINGIKYDIYTLNPDGVDWNWGNLEKTIYKNELLSWTGTANDGVTSNLEALTGDLGDTGVGVKISGYFSPVVTNNYIFKFTDNDDTITFDLVEYGENIDNGAILLTNYTSNQITLDSTKIYEFRMSYKQATGPYNFQPQVDIANSGTFVDLYNPINFTFYEISDTSFTSSQNDYNLSDPNQSVQKYTYYVFKSEKAGSTYIWQYNDRTNEWYQLSNTIYNSPLSLEPQNDNSGTSPKINESGRIVVIGERNYQNGNIKVMQYNPYGKSIANLYGSGINAPNTILTNNQRLYQGSYITSPNKKYILAFPEWYGILELRYNPDPEDTNIDLNSQTDFNSLDRLYFINYDVHSGNRDNAYIVMEYGNLNVYNLFGVHKYSYTTNSKSGVLSLDDNGNLSIVENWIQKGNNIIGIRGQYIDDDNFYSDISNDGLTLAVGSSSYDLPTDTNYNNIGALRIYNFNNVLTLTDVNSLDVGSSIDVSIDITDGYGNETKRFTVSNIDDTTIGEVRVLSNTIIIYEGSTLTADTTSLTDPDDTINITYQWEISSDSNTYISISGATNSTFTIPKDTESTESYVGQYIRLKVVANDIEFYSDPKLVINLEDEATGTLSFVSNIISIQEGAILTAVTNLSDIDNKKLITDTNDDQSLNFSYQWQISLDNSSFTNIDNATTNQYQIPISIYTDQYIRLSIKTTDVRGGTTDFLTTSRLIGVNNSPFFNTNPVLVAYEGQEYEYTFTFSDADPNQIVTITDITYPSWISFDTNSNKLSGTPTSNDIENNDISITISDGTNDTVQNFTINVNRAPVLENELTFTFDEDEIINPIDLDLYFTDYDTTDTINYTINSYDSNFLTASIDINRKLNLVLVNDKFGSSNITITATDGYNSITRTGTININSVNDDPTGTISIIGTALPNQTLTVDLTQIIDIDDSSLIYNYIWQMSSDTNIWDTSNDVSTSSTYTIPDTNDNENKYIRVKVTIEDSDTNNTEFISNEVQIQKLDLVTSFSINGSTDEDNNYTFDLSSIIDTNYDVSFQLNVPTEFSWSQIGETITGSKPKISSDGTNLIFRDTNDDSIKILKYENGNWTQKGSTIEINSLYFAISNDGNKVAIQQIIATSEGDEYYIHIYEYSSNDWNKISEINDPLEFGEITFSTDDNAILIGDSLYNNRLGILRLYAITTLTPFELGDNFMLGETERTRWGSSNDVSNSNIGKFTIAGGTKTVLQNGYVKIYYFVSDDQFYQMGSILNSENDFDGFGWDISLSNDGSNIAIGAPFSDSNSGNNSYVKIYEFINNDWSLKGQKLEGDEGFGSIVKLSSNGLRLAVLSRPDIKLYDYDNNIWNEIISISSANITEFYLNSMMEVD